jgi:hypothetical protein
VPIKVPSGNVILPEEASLTGSTLMIEIFGDCILHSLVQIVDPEVKYFLFESNIRP